MVSRHRELSLDYRNCFDIRTEEKFVAARHRNQHARRMRYPDHDVPRGVSFWPSFVSRTSHPRAEIRSRNSSLWFQFFSRLAFSRSFASCATSAGSTTSFSVSRSRTLLTRDLFRELSRIKNRALRKCSGHHRALLQIAPGVPSCLFRCRIFLRPLHAAAPATHRYGRALAALPPFLPM